MINEIYRWDHNQSHQHSLQTLEMLNGFDDFKASVKHMADFGCGKGYDVEYWGHMQEFTEDGKPGRYLNINCVGFDLDAESNTPSRKNIKYKNHDFNSHDVIWSVPFDIVWCHNLMQHIYSPVEFLGRVNKAMAMGSMLYLCVPSTVTVFQNKFQNYTPGLHYNTFTVSQILYLIALNGFDIKDFYLQKEKHVDLIQILTYKEREPLPYNTTWYEMADMGILNDNITELVMKNGTLNDQGLVLKWLDGVVYDFRWHTI